jgi:hypothetical protein
MRTKFSLLATAMLFGLATTTQGQLIFNDDFDGGGGSMWHYENGTQTNQWVIGSATYAGSSGKSLYISNDGGVSNIYTISNATSIVHAYVDITFPECAGGKLSFDWKCNGQSSSYDNLAVCVIEDSITPVAGTNVVEGRVKIGTYYGKTEWQHVEFSFPTTYSNVTKRLLFTWYNNSSSGAQPPAAIDNVRIEVFPFVHKTVNLDVAGTLKDVADIESVTSLKISGPIDARDFKFMRDDMSILMELDISEANIVEYNGDEGTSYYLYAIYPANQIPETAFSKRLNSTKYEPKLSLKTVYLPENLISVGFAAFALCEGITTVTLPLGLQSIEEGAFAQCYGLGTLVDGFFVLPGSLSSIGKQAFYGCTGLTSIYFPPNIESIGEAAFRYCTALTEANLTGVKTLGGYAFSNCDELVSVLLPENLTSVGTFSQSAFGDCPKLTIVKSLNPTAITFYSNTFPTNALNGTLIVPTNSVNLYKNTEYWNLFSNITGGGYAFTRKVNNPLYGHISGAETEIYLEESYMGVMAYPYPDAAFINWTNQNGDTVSNGSTYYFSLSENTVLTANFKSTDVNLNDISVDLGALYPDFNPDVLNYYISVPSNRTNVIIYATPNHSKASVTGTGTKQLNEGTNIFEITVTSEYGNTKTYTITVNRAFMSRVPVSEDFETGGSLDWQISNQESWGNKWYIGNLAAHSGNQAVYICYNGYDYLGYNIYNPSTAFLYCDVVFPESNVQNYQLSFDWKGKGEVYNETPYDYMAVYIISTDITPVARFNSSLSYLLPNDTPLGKYYNAETWQHAVIDIPNYANQTKRLVFGWQNDNEGGTGDPIVIDNISINSISTSISDISVDNAKIIGYYSIMGQRLPQEPEHGIYIIRYDNGTARKTIKQ